MAPLRICYLTYPPERYSGAVFHAFWLAEKLAPRGVEIDFLSFTREARPRRSEMRGFPVHYLRMPEWLGSYGELAFWPQLARFFRRERFDVVHVHSCGYLESFAAVAAGLNGTASIGNIMQQGSDLAPAGRLAAPLHRRLLRAFDRVVPISDETYAEALAVGLPPARLTQIPIGVDTERFRPTSAEERQRLRAGLGLPADAVVVSYVGAFSERKNVVWLVDSWLASRSAADGAHLLLVGDVANDPDGHEVRRQVERRLAEAGERIHWIRFVDEIERIYAVSDAFVLPSLREGMPSVVLQAMASGLPVLSTPVAGAPELLGRNDERGLLFGFGDEPGFHTGLERLLGDPALGATLGRAARDYVLDHCSLDRVAADYLALYRKLARRGSAPLAAATRPPHRGTGSMLRSVSGSRPVDGRRSRKR